MSTKNTNNLVKGSTFIALSAFFYASYGIWTKLMTGFFAEFNQAWIRALLSLLILVPIGIIGKQFASIKKIDWPWFLVISLAGGLNQAPIFFGFSNLNIGTATLLFYTTLVMGSFIFGKLFFAEKISLIKGLSLILAIIGMSIIYSFSLGNHEILPAILIALAGLMGSSVTTFSKKLSNNYSETQILTSIFASMLIINFLISLLLKEKPPALIINVAWLSQLAYAISMLIANSFVITGYKHLQPSIAGLIGLLEIIFATTFGIIIFADKLTISTIIGGGVILLAIALPQISEIMRGKE